MTIGRGGSTDTERGAATVLVTACLGLLLLVGCALAVVAAMIAAHRSAQAAADLAALAGAVAARDGDDPCAAAGSVAAANGARLTRCTTAGTEVTVEVVAPGPRWLGQTHDLAATARAGPAEVPTAAEPG
ncbi:Rv3654c family TadE-like protein [Nocardioides sp. HM23]|uniref:Rv3654c family TadE-like protein n=1 Tax=Nocardioides bizhenqiangii TaxID=3095076 RepID=UPI002ACAF709|nr:Rv3654c family TadE-like protein [Nocardioides sp. HM23]MDZ5622563.1 Rv3654c family TadE-like protein [Nocardioides sp. HM23]